MKKTSEPKKIKESSKVVPKVHREVIKKEELGISTRRIFLAHGVGRRKRAIARVWLSRGKGAIRVNDKDLKDYFETDFNRDKAAIPFKVLSLSQYNVEANVVGGGLNAQAEAVKLGISRALVSQDPSIRPALKKWHLLSVDSRVKERKKYGQKAARRKFQFVKR